METSMKTKLFAPLPTSIERLEHALIAGRVTRRSFVRAAAAFGLAGSGLNALADELDAIRANQAEREPTTTS
jgi:choline dehydrogenase